MARVTMELNTNFEHTQNMQEHFTRLREIAAAQQEGAIPSPSNARSLEEEFEKESGFGFSMEELFEKGSKKAVEEVGEELALGALKETLAKFVDVSIEGGIATITMPAMVLEMFASIFQGLEKGAER